MKIDRSSARFTTQEGISKATNRLDNAGFWHNVKKKNGTKVPTYKPVINSDDVLTMRLQGLDAPELHYMTGKPLFRQLMGETAGVELYRFLKRQTNSNTIPCEVFTLVNEPNDVFDKYGRCVGDIIIRDKDGKSININNWLVEQGHAYPAFYNSMTTQEINNLRRLSNKALRRKLNAWGYISYKMKSLDRKLTHDKKDLTYSPQADRRSPVIFPKLFRRLWEFEIKNKTAFSTGGYKEFVDSRKNDRCCSTNVFLSGGFPKKAPLLGSFLDKSGKINFKPAEIVFREAGTTLKDNKGNKITSF